MLSNLITESIYSREEIEPDTPDVIVKKDRGNLFFTYEVEYLESIDGKAYVGIDQGEVVYELSENEIREVRCVAAEIMLMMGFSACRASIVFH